MIEHLGNMDLDIPLLCIRTKLYLRTSTPTSTASRLNYILREIIHKNAPHSQVDLSRSARQSLLERTLSNVYYHYFHFIEELLRYQRVSIDALRYMMKSIVVDDIPILQ